MLEQEQMDKIAQFLEGKTLSSGLGTRSEPCSLAAINLALTGKLTDDIPDCMSQVLGRWIIYVQDGMPGNIRNSKKWRQLLSRAAGTGRDREWERAEILVDHMWRVSLPLLQVIAHKNGFSKVFSAMLADKTPGSILAAMNFALEAGTDTALRLHTVLNSAHSAVAHAEPLRNVRVVSQRTSYVIVDVAQIRRIHDEEDYDAVMRTVDPVGLFEKLVNLPEEGDTDNVHTND